MYIYIYIYIYIYAKFMLYLIFVLFKGFLYAYPNHPTTTYSHNNVMHAERCNEVFGSSWSDKCVWISADFALRSPFPVIHLLRQCDVEAAEDDCSRQGFTTEDIALRNEARLRWVSHNRIHSLISVEMDTDIVSAEVKGCASWGICLQESQQRPLRSSGRSCEKAAWHNQ